MWSLFFWLSVWAFGRLFRCFSGDLTGNAEFYCSRGLPFVMGTTGGDREKLIEDVLKSGVYSVIAPQMGKQVGYISCP